MHNKKLPEVGHIGYIVANIEESAQQFQAYYGVESFTLYDFVPKRAWSYGEEIFDCKLRIGLSKNTSGPKIEIIQPVSGKNIPHMSFLKQKGQNIHHVAYYVDDYTYWHDYFENYPGSRIIFEAEIEDEIFGRRCSFYAECAKIAGVIEISKKC